MWVTSNLVMMLGKTKVNELWQWINAALSSTLALVLSGVTVTDFMLILLVYLFYTKQLSFLKLVAIPV